VCYTKGITVVPVHTGWRSLGYAWTSSFPFHFRIEFTDLVPVHKAHLFDWLGPWKCAFNLQTPDYGGRRVFMILSRQLKTFQRFSFVSPLCILMAATSSTGCIYWLTHFPSPPSQDCPQLEPSVSASVQRSSLSFQLRTSVFTPANTLLSTWRWSSYEC
jgi:hypothetical protein